MAELEQLRAQAQEAREVIAAADRAQDELKVSLQDQEEALRNRDTELQHLQRQLRYYVKISEQNHLPVLPEHEYGVEDGGSRPAFREASGGGMSHDEREKLQRVASTTINSLQGIVEEKNRMIEKMRRKLEETRAEMRRNAAADKHEIELLTNKMFRENEDAIDQLKTAAKHLEGAAKPGHGDEDMNRRLLDQLEEQADAARRREEVVNELELKLVTANNKTQRAEGRCTDALHEIEKMKADMLVMAAQLQDAEERVLEAASTGVAAAPGPVGGASPSREPASASAAGKNAPLNKKIQYLQEQLGAKDKKVSALRLAIVNLKREFEKAEVANLKKNLANEEEKEGSGVKDNEALRDQVMELNDKLGVMHKQLQKKQLQAEEEVVKARQQAKKFKVERDRLRAEADANDRRLGELEGDKASLEDAMREAKAEVERQRNRADARRRPGSSGAGGEGGEGGGQRLEAAMRTVERLRDQNKHLTAENETLQSALDRARSRTGGASASASAGGGGMSTRAVEEEKGGDEGPASVASGRSAAASTTSGPPRNANRERALAAKLKKAEERLHDQAEALEEAKGRERQARDLVETLTKAKEKVEKQLGVKSREANKLAAGGAEGLDDLEQCRRERDEALRKADDMGRAELQLSSQLRQMEAQLNHAQAEANQLQDKLDKAGPARSGGGGGGAEESKSGGGAFAGRGRSLRESDDAMLRASALQDELDALRREKKQLELKLLAQDSGALELEFDANITRQESERLKRRVRELEAAFQAVAAQGGNGGNARVPAPGEGAYGPGDRKAGARFQRERDLEGVVDGLQRVVHKLKSENERLRNGAADQAKISAAERRARESKSALARVEEELASMRARATAGDDAMNRLAQRTEQVNQLKRQLRVRDDESRGAKRQMDEALQRAGRGDEEANQAARRVAQLEEQVASLKARESQSNEVGGDVMASMTSQVEQMRRERDQARKALADAPRELSNTSRASRSGDYGESRDRSSSGRESEDMRQLRVELASAQREQRRTQERLDRAMREGGGGGGGGDSAEQRRLQDENAKLKAELSHFDLDFFEEIEDLKYKYAEALRKLRQYE